MAKILIIDDDPDFVLALRVPLEAHGFEVEEAGSAEEGIAKVLGARPDLVILDVMMPAGYEGFEAARAIRERHGLRDLPIVILTSLHDQHQVPYRFAPDETYLPVDVFLDKPVKLEALVEVVDELLGERREEPEHPL
jgi:CheY-like chemotaxis protein